MGRTWPDRARIHVIAVNYHSAGALRRCLATLLPTPVDAITVLDNGSGPADVAALRELERTDGRVRVIAHDENVGFGAGVNRAVKLAAPAPEDHLWILNPDTTVHPDAPALLSDELRRGADIVSPLIVTGQPETTWFAGGRVDERRGETRHFGEGSPPPRDHVAPFDTPFITGAAPMLTARTWARLGGFREDLFLYWEDADLSRRARELGLTLTVVPQARVWHEQGTSSAGGRGGNGPPFYYYNQRNRVLVCSPAAGAWRMVAVTGLRETLRLVVKPLLLETSPRWPKVVASVRGLRDGLAGRTGRGPV